MTPADDGGFASRKFLALLVTQALVLISAKWLSLDPINGLIAAYGLYLGGNVTRFWAASKADKGATAPTKAKAAK